MSMPVQLAIKFTDADIEMLDVLVAEGYGATRTEVVRAAVSVVVAEARYRQQVEAERAALSAFPDSAADLARWEATGAGLCGEEDWSNVYSTVDGELRVDPTGVIKRQQAPVKYGSAA